QEQSVVWRYSGSASRHSLVYPVYASCTRFTYMANGNSPTIIARNKQKRNMLAYKTPRLKDGVFAPLPATLSG
ncbi:MAG TPA: hypothetical protein PLY16_03485, partial [Candidatus Saccharibacteria bacterium]|nr:hypothetical protein [Candidatus Saccharibacteria bacterium]